MHLGNDDLQVVQFIAVAMKLNITSFGNRSNCRFGLVKDYVSVRLLKKGGAVRKIEN
jgi:hypothetical protein